MSLFTLLFGVVMGEYTGNTPQAEVSRLMGAAWINFANNLDPNGPRGKRNIVYPRTIVA